MAVVWVDHTRLDLLEYRLCHAAPTVEDMAVVTAEAMDSPLEDSRAATLLGLEQDICQHQGWASAPLSAQSTPEVTEERELSVTMLDLI